MPLRIDGDVWSDLEARVRTALRGADGALLVDYGKGVLAPGGARRLVAACSEAAVPAAVDPKGHLDAYAGARLVKPNLPEAKALLGTEVGPLELATRLAERLPGSDVAITCGASGMVVAEAARGGAPVRVPTAALDVYDVQGAGDTALAALWLARLAGAPLVDAAIVANAAAGVAVSKVGTATASVAELRVGLPRVLDAVRSGDGGARIAHARDGGSR